MSEDNNDIEVVLTPPSKPGYSEALLNAIPLCPKYVKRVRLVLLLMRKFNINREKAENIVEETLESWIKKGVVKRHEKLKGYYCRVAS
jgi:hypothetical protein